jgi:glutamate dehydrogenase
VLDLDKIWAEIEALDYQQSAQDQAMFLLKIMRLGRRSTRWIIRNRRGCVNTETQIRQLQPILNNLMNQAVELSVERPEKARNDIHDYLEKGLSPYGAVLIDSANDLFFAFGMADVAIKTGLPLELVNSAYSLIEDQLQIEWFSRQIIDLTPITRWEDYARESFMDDLESLFRSLVIMMLEPVSELAELEDKIDSWQTTQSVLLERWRAMIQELKASSQRQYAMFSVALRELQDLVDSTREGTLSPLCEVDE